VPRDRLHVTGALKDGAAPLPVDRAERDRMAEALAGRALWLAASTHPGEEEMAAEAQCIAAAAVPGLALVLAPRHPERGAALAEMLAARGLRVARRGAGQMPEPATDVYLADTLGEMGLWFDLCPITFLGGSLVPVGGHNALEPARMGSAILHGPQVGNFAPLYADLAAAGGARVVTDAAALGAAVIALQDAGQRAAMTAAARAVADRPGDAAERTAAILRALIPPGPRPRGRSAAAP
jgi:3-deoxy-D-manno-octulosonic-acid transferase